MADQENKRVTPMAKKRDMEAIESQLQPAKKNRMVSGELSSNTAEIQDHPKSSRGRYPTIHNSYVKALNSGSKEKALQILKEEQPRYFILHYHNIINNLDNAFQPSYIPWVSPYSLDSFTNVPEGMQQWKQNYFNCYSAARPWKPKSLIIECATRTGKTLWARSLGQHNYLCGYLDLNPTVYSNDAEYNVVDSFNPKFLKHWKELIGAQRDWQSKCKNRKSVQIKGGIPAIMLCNPGPGSSYSEYLDKPGNEALKAWTLQNATFISLEKHSSPPNQKKIQLVVKNLNQEPQKENT